MRARKGPPASTQRGALARMPRHAARLHRPRSPPTRSVRCPGVGTPGVASPAPAAHRPSARYMGRSRRYCSTRRWYRTASAAPAVPERTSMEGKRPLPQRPHRKAEGRPPGGPIRLPARRSRHALRPAWTAGGVAKLRALTWHQAGGAAAQLEQVAPRAHEQPEAGQLAGARGRVAGRHRPGPLQQRRHGQRAGGGLQQRAHAAALQAPCGVLPAGGRGRWGCGAQL